jgi:hypothetical protein
VGISKAGAFFRVCFLKLVHKKTQIFEKRMFFYQKSLEKRNFFD